MRGGWYSSTTYGNERGATDGQHLTRKVQEGFEAIRCASAKSEDMRSKRTSDNHDKLKRLQFFETVESPNMSLE